MEFFLVVGIDVIFFSYVTPGSGIRLFEAYFDLATQFFKYDYRGGSCDIFQDVAYGDLYT